MSRPSYISLFLIITLLPACDFIFEPPEDALDRFLEAAITRDTQKIDEMAEDQTVADQAKSIGLYLDGTAFKNINEKWRVTNIREDEGADRTYLTTIFYVPRKQRRTRSRRPRKVQHYEIEVVFEMQRRYLKWYIHSIENADKLIKRLQATSDGF